MANFRFILNPLAYTPTATSADSNFPITNLSVLSPLERKWAALVATGIVNVTLDFGSALNGLAANPGLFLDDMNVTSIRIQGNSVTTDWVTPPWDQALTIAEDEQVMRYKGFFRIADLNAAAFGYRYLNIRILSQTPTDAANYRIARVVVGQILELTANPSYDSGATRHDEWIDTKFSGGGMERSVMGEPYVALTWPRRLPSETARSEQHQIEDVLTPFVMWDAGRGGSQDAWLLWRMDDAEMKTTFLHYFDTHWGFREVT